MKKYGNILINRRMVIVMCLLVVAVNFMMPKQTVHAYDYVTYTKIINAHFTDEDGRDCDYVMSLSVGATMPFYSVVFRSSSDSSFMYGFVFPYGCKTDGNVNDKCNVAMYVGGVRDTSVTKPWGATGIYLNKVPSSFVYGYSSKCSYISSNCEYQAVGDTVSDAQQKFLKYLNGESVDGVSKYSDIKSTAVTNESIGYLQDVKLNLSYITPIKGDSIFETTNYQIYSDLIYNLKWNSKKTSTNYDLSSSYVQLYAKAEYSKSEYDNVSATDFIELGNYEKASKGKLKFSFLELFEKSNNCKSAYFSAFPLSSADYKNGKLQACSVTSNIKYKFYIRVYKGTDKGPWLCVSEKGSHHSNEFVNSGDKVPFNVSSGDLDSDGTFKPDGNINENGNGTTGTGTDKDDADADTNANDKIQTKHDNSDNSVWDNLENLVSGIASVPIIIKDIFSFLPSWCLNVTATGFALMITVCVIRFIRGK